MRRIYLDPCDTLSNFLYAVTAQFNRLDLYNAWPASHAYSVPQVLGVDYDEYWAALDAAGPDFWRSMPTLPTAQKLWTSLEEVARVKRLEVFVLIKGTRNIQSTVGQLGWWGMFLGELRMYCCTDRLEAVAAPETVYISTCEKSLAEYSMFGGDGIIYPAVTNRYGASPTDEQIADVLRPLWELEV